MQDHKQNKAIAHELSCTKRGNDTKFPKQIRYETGPQKMETSGETPGETPYIYIYSFKKNKALYCKKNIMIYINDILEGKLPNPSLKIW